MALVNFKRGTKPASVTNLDADTIYFFTDTKEIYLGATPYGKDLTDVLSRLAQAEEDIDGVEGDIEDINSSITSLEAWKATHATEYSTLKGTVDSLQTALAKKLDSLTAADASVTVGGTDTAKTVKVAISEKTSGNALTLAEDGLAVTVPAATDYTVTVTEQQTADTGYAKTYVIAQEATSLNAKINIPKDLVVSKGEIVNSNGSTSGTFIKLTLNNDDVIYIDVKDLVDEVEANNGENPVVSITVTEGHKIAATLNNGTVTKTHLVTAVQTMLDHGESAYDALTWGTI